MSEADAQKKAAGEAAAALVESGMVVGLGTGSTAACFVRALGERKLDVTCVATSLATEELATSVGLKVAQLGETREIDLTVDGADEVGPGLALIKGGGAALLREKLVWEASRRCVVIADAAKVVKTLGRFPLPIEVVAFGHKTIAARICDVLAEFEIGMAPRLRVKDGQPVRTDGGNLIYDAACGRIEEPASLAAALKSITGVVDHGLFLDLAEQALIGAPDGVTTLEP
ncbi:ribose-5-phosphate isomerase RpiA [Phenylobacterium sp.]|uniref:ribose-5-phosphate isomerase RpiA n=1 Tax=Phenylobacterium sp. TaxID=1871053 RepID=UPI002BF6B841|nr:ribose-5-phosphate isomerase RpiA [Phenylobacterium sp.]HVI33176.1 ribose-5-phosphate isomerase RpiA [Phenylobacterium sp.]